MKRIALFVPLAMLVVFVALVAWRLARPDSGEAASHVVGKPVAALVLPPILPAKPGLRTGPERGPMLINLFASWCGPCIAEAPMLLELQRAGLPIDGVALRDRPQDVALFLARHGDPFRTLGSDPDSAAQLALGATGVPETLIVDRAGIVRFHHRGPLQAGDLARVRAAWSAAQ